MKRALLILLVAASVASAQTFITVTADTNRVVRTNFSLVRSQISDLSGASFAISNITGLQAALDGKMTTNDSAAGLTNFPASLLTTNGDAVGLTNFPASLLRTNGSAGALTNFPAALLQTNSALTNFPAGLLRTNGDGSGLTNLPNANLSNAIGVLPVSNGGSGATNAETARTNFGLVWSGLTNADAAGFRTALSLGTAATNEASAFQPASSALTNLAVNNAASLTNFPAELLRTNGDGGALTNVQVDLNAVLPSYSNNVGKVLSVAAGETNVEWTAISNTVTDGSLITNFPSYLLQTNGSAAGLTNFPADLLRTNGSAASLTSFPTFNQNTTGTANNVTGTVQIANGGTGAGNAANARINLLPSYTGNELRVLALNSNATDVVWSVDGGGQANLTNVTNTLAIANGGTGGTNAAQAFTNLGVFGSALVVLGGGASNVTGGNTIVGSGATADDGLGNGAVAIGREVVSSNSAVSIGYQARGLGEFAVAVGYQATNTTGRGAAIGYRSRVSGDGFAAGDSAVATGADSVQLGSGTITNSNSIQFLSAGVVDTNEWARIAALSTYPTTNIQITVVGGVTNTLVFSNGILTSVTTP
jgi:hypothetical protein